MAEQPATVPYPPLPSPPADPGDPARRIRSVWGYLLLLVALAAVAVAATYFLFNRVSPVRVYYIPTVAMEPTLMGHEAGLDPRTGEAYQVEIHDRVAVSTLAYIKELPRIGDIVVFRAPKGADMLAEVEHREPVESVLDKRIVGVPGDVIQIKDGAIWRNGNRVDEPVCDATASNQPCIKEKMQQYEPEMATYGVKQPLKLGPNEFYLLDDNRNHSSDSRHWGPLDKSRIVGKVYEIVSPSNRARSFP